MLKEMIAKTKVQPRPYQERIVQKLIQMYSGEYVDRDGKVEPASKSVMIESPTGSGKSVMGLVGCKLWQMMNPDLHIGWVAMRRNLLTQASRENRDKEINVENIHFISMFEQEPVGILEAKAAGKPILFVVDECLAGDTMVHALVDDQQVLVSISDIVDNGIGTHVLSLNHDSGVLEWKPIVSRTCTGVREVFEVEIETEDGRSVTVVATDNHRFFTADGYKRVDELALEDEVYVKHSEQHVLIRAKIKSIKPKGTTTTYDIGVADNHNFFANGVLVHNCQHDAASSMTHLHNIIEPDYILGLTATPFRVDKMKLCFDKVIKDAGIHALIQDGFLSRFDHYTIDEWTPEVVCDRYSLEPERWGKSIFYFKNTAECYELQRLLAARGFASEVVTGDSDCDTQLDMFRRGEVKCLINCMKLTEGFDEPSLKTAWVRDSGKGCTMQMGGRAFRLHADTPRKNIVQSKNTRWPFIKTAMPVLQYVWQNDTWVSLTINPKINMINDNARIAIAMTDVQMPAFIKNRMKKPSRRVRF